MKKFILLFALCLPFLALAQNDDKYLEGAVPLKDGKVTFSTEMNAPGLSKEQIYETLLDWANQRFQPTEKMNARVLFQNPEEGNIAIGGEEYIVFSKSALSLDRTRIYYQLRIFCQDGKSSIEMTRIRYWYDEARDGGEKYEAESWITDKWGLNKSKTKLAPISGKFRKKTIDLKDELFLEIQAKLDRKTSEQAMQGTHSTPDVVTQPNPVQEETQQTIVLPVGNIPTEPAKPIPSSQEILIAQAVRVTITGGNDEQFEISKECWGGFGEMFGQKVAFCFIDTQKTMGNMLMTQSDNYTISFYSADNRQPEVVIHCKKLMQNNISGEEAKKMNPNYVDGKSYNMYVGAVLK